MIMIMGFMIYTSEVLKVYLTAEKQLCIVQFENF